MVWPFSKNKSDPDLEQLKSGSWICPETGRSFSGLSDLAAFAPDAWTGAEEYEPNSAIRMEGEFLSEDFCVMTGLSGNTNYLVRCVLPIRVQGLDDTFAFGCWGTLKRENFELYLEHFDAGTVPEEGRFFSWLCNDIKPFGLTKPLECVMLLRPERQRPVLHVTDEHEPLALAQEHGISAKRLCEIYEAHGYKVA